MISLVLLLGVLSSVLGQETRVTCDSSYQWSFNSLNQSPCVVASYLQGACSETQPYTVYDLPDGYYYSGPKNPTSANYCWCSSITYALLGECTLCQGKAEVITWGEWTANCSDPITSNGYWPQEFPAGTAVPAWAVQTFLSNQTFSGIVAQEIASTNKTELKQQAIVDPSSSSRPSESLTSSPSPSAKTDSPGSGTNVAAIAGGVAGGVGGALVIGAILFFVYRRRASNRRMSAPSNMMQHQYPELVTPVSQNAGRRLYDPSDPSTFPVSPPPISPGGSYQPTSPTGTPSSAYHQFQPVRPANY